MLKELENLPTRELETMLKAPLLVCILIAGADDEIDRKEMKGAIGLAKKGKTKVQLSEFYKLATEDFEDKLKILLQGFPKDPVRRNKVITEELAALNGILPKINRALALDFYKSLTYIAKAIAKSSGGVLGLNKVGEEESMLMSLPMIKDPSVS